MLPDKIGRYKIEKEIGRGGMAVVYLAHDPRFGRNVALKLLPLQIAFTQDLYERFNKEAKIVASLEHPAIVPVYDFGDVNNQPYMVMRYMPGGSLRDRIKSQPLSLQRTIDILSPLVGALDYAHAQGIIHRDLKPENTLFDQTGHAHLADFGIARMAEASHTMTMIGTVGYMSPEQITGDRKLDYRSDLYALGVILFEMLAARPPYTAERPTPLMMKHVYEPVPSVLDANNKLPPGVQGVIRRAMAKSPDDRYDSAATMVSALKELLVADHVPPVLPPTEQQSPLPVPKRKVPTRAWLVGLLLFLAIASYMVWTFAGGESSTSSSSEATRLSALALIEKSATPTHTRRPPASATPSRIVPSTEPQVVVPLMTSTTTTVESDPATATVSATATVTRTSTATPQAEIQVNASSTNLRSGPGAVYEGVRILRAGAIARIIARNRDGTWFNVQLDDGTSGWLAASVGETNNLPAVTDLALAATIPALPQVTSTQVAIDPQATATEQTVTGSGNGGGSSGGNDDGGGGSDPTSPPPPTAADPQPTAADP